MSEKQLPILMACRLSVRYEVNQLKAVPDIPYHVDKRVIKLFDTVAKDHETCIDTDQRSLHCRS